MTSARARPSDPIERFAIAAERYCAWIEGPAGVADREVETAIRHLLELVACALDLPDVDVDDSEVDPARAATIASVRQRLSVLPVGLYGTLDPDDVTGDEPLVGDVLDDLADVWRDVRDGLDDHRVGRTGEACWTWRFSFHNHWGKHATDALRVLMTRLRAE